MVTGDSEWDWEAMEGGMGDREVSCRTVRLDRENECHAGCWEEKLSMVSANTEPFTLQCQHTKRDVSTDVTAAA